MNEVTVDLGGAGCATDESGFDVCEAPLENMDESQPLDEEEAEDDDDELAVFELYWGAGDDEEVDTGAG